MKMLWLLSAAVFVHAFAPSSSWALAISPQCIYGSDDRLEYKEISSHLHRHAANASALMLYKKNIKRSTTSTGEKIWRLNNAIYGESEKLCNSEPFYGQPSLGFCSGTLIAPNLVLTAGHCIENAKDCRGAAIAFGFYMDGGYGPNQLRESQVYTCKRLVAGENADLDFAIIELDRDVEDVEPIALASRRQMHNGEEIFMAGYPMGIPLKLSAKANVRESRPMRYVANLDSLSGNSGSGVFAQDTGELIGVLVAGEEDYEKDPHHGCMREMRCHNEDCVGEDVVKLTKIAPFLPAFLQ